MNINNTYSVALYGWTVGMLAKVFDTFIPRIIKDESLKEFRDGLWSYEKPVVTTEKEGITITFDAVAKSLSFECPDEVKASSIAQKVSGIARKRLVTVPFPERFFSGIYQRLIVVV